VTIVLGHPLIAMNHNQLDKKASFRAALAGRGRRLQLIFLRARGDLATNPWGSTWQLRPKGYDVGRTVD
jgi:hypothetical protein